MPKGSCLCRCLLGVDGQVYLKASLVSTLGGTGTGCAGASPLACLASERRENAAGDQLQHPDCGAIPAWDDGLNFSAPP
jgi:hypothetical protein